MAQNHLYRIQERQGKRDTYEVYKMTPDMDPVTVYVAVVNQWHEAPPESFRDALSKKEYTLSGMCQACQDKTFGR